jgi:hypothetical protein
MLGDAIVLARCVIHGQDAKFETLFFLAFPENF